MIYTLLALIGCVTGTLALAIQIRRARLNRAESQRRKPNHERLVKDPKGLPLNVACPTCKASIGQWCLDPDKSAPDGSAWAAGAYPQGVYHLERAQLEAAKWRGAS